MFQKVTRAAAERLPAAVVTDGIALCPRCWRPLLQVLPGGGDVVVWCRQCRRHITVKQQFRQEPESR